MTDENDTSSWRGYVDDLIYAGRAALARNPGAWKGVVDGSEFRLTANENREAGAAWRQAKWNRPAVDHAMRDLTRSLKPQGGALVGLTHSLKTIDSLRRKMATELGRASAPSVNAAMPKDLLRYTITLPAQTYVAGATRAIEGMRNHGNVLLGLEE